MPLAVTDIDPGSGPAGTVVTITVADAPTDVGVNETWAYLGDVQATVESVDIPATGGDGTITARVADGSKPGLFEVIVWGGKGRREVATGSQLFDVSDDNQAGPAPANSPQVDSMIPRNPQPAIVMATRVQLTGSNLDRVTTVWLGTRRVTVPPGGGSNRLQFFVPAPAPSTDQLVTVWVQAGDEPRVVAPGRLLIQAAGTV